MKIRKNNVSRFLCIISGFILLPNTKISAQLTVTPNQTAAVLASTLAGTCVTILNASETCPGVANGLFNSTGTLLGMSNGIILTNGHSAACAGPYGAPPGTASFNDGAPGDPALAPFLPPGTNTYDACILEFDVVAAGDSIGFNYQFGSQEYYHSTCGEYPDIFAFFISGPGITGAPNIALVPGTNIPVEINSVNAGAPGGPGGLGPGVNIVNCTSLGAGSPFTSYFISNVGGTQLSYTGYTTKLRAVHAVSPCDTYHLKLSIADANNSGYDSGVFLEARSLTPPTIPGAIVCVGGTATLTPTTTGGTWVSGNPSIASIGSSTGITTGISGGTATISYFIGPTCSINTIVTVNELSPITGSANVCTGNTITLADISTGGSWSSSNTLVATIGSASGIVNGLTTGTTIISYTTASGCITNETVTVNSVSPVTGPTNICIGTTTTLSDITGGGTWSSNSTTIATVSSSGIVTALSAGTVNFTYTAPNGCIATMPITIGSFSTSNLNISICQGNSFTFAGTIYTVSGTYSHTYATSTCDSIVTLHLTVYPTVNTILNDSICAGSSYTFAGATYTTTGVYTHTAANIHSCDSTVTLNLFVKPIPPMPTVVSPVNYCLGQSTTPLNASGYNLVWYTDAGGAGNTTPPTPTSASAGTTWYYVNEVQNGCAGPLDSIEVIIFPQPTAAINALKTSLCQYDTSSFFATAVPSGTYSWNTPGTNIISGSTTTQNIVAQFNTLGNHIIFLTVRENGECQAVDSLDINVIPVPVSTFYVKPNVCIGDTVIVAVSYTTPGVTNCIWNFEDATVLTATTQVSGGPYGVTWNTTGIHYIQMSSEIGQCTSNEVTDTIDVHALPNAQLNDLTPGNICTGDSVLLSAVIQDPSNLYQWSPLSFFHNTNRPEIYGVIQNAGYVTLSVTTPYGCIGTDSLMIDAQPCCEMLFSNAFTPNGDGKNDAFHPLTNGHHIIHTFMIKNRYGQTVFETINENDAWNGTFNGVPQDIGTYFYYIKYDCNGKTLEQKGDVTLIR